MNRLNGKVSLITGANSGIGRRTAEVFADEGSDLVLVARRIEKLREVEEICKAKGVNAISVSADVTKIEDCERAVKAAIDTFGKLDVLVNNAGIADDFQSVTYVKHEFWDKVVQLDLYSVFYMMKEALKYMVPAGKGSIVNISSIGGTRSVAGVSYSAAKAGVIAATKNVALQFAGTDIRANVVAPGPTPSPLWDMMGDVDTAMAEISDRHIDRTLTPATADDQAKAILYFASDDSIAVTGQTIVVDRGTSL